MINDIARSSSVDDQTSADIQKKNASFEGKTCQKAVMVSGERSKQQGDPSPPSRLLRPGSVSNLPR